MPELLLKPWQAAQRLTHSRCSKTFIKEKKEGGKEREVEEGREGEKEGSKSGLVMFV